VRRPSQDRFLPPWAIQVFGMLTVAAIVAAGILEVGDPTVLLGALTLAGGFVLLNGIYERLRQTAERKLEAPDEDREVPR
jgi:hypothetical protein